MPPHMLPMMTLTRGVAARPAVTARATIPSCGVVACKKIQQRMGVRRLVQCGKTEVVCAEVRLCPPVPLAPLFPSLSLRLKLTPGVAARPAITARATIAGSGVIACKKSQRRMGVRRLVRCGKTEVVCAEVRLCPPVPLTLSAAQAYPRRRRQTRHHRPGHHRRQWSHRLQEEPAENGCEKAGAVWQDRGSVC